MSLLLLGAQLWFFDAGRRAWVFATDASVGAGAWRGVGTGTWVPATDAGVGAGARHRA